MLNKKRTINLIVIHCSATRVTQDFTIEDLTACHKSRGFTTIGRPESEVGAHARHYNSHSLGICYEGGLDKNGRPANTLTPAQKESLEALLYSLAIDYPDADILGHRDLPGVRKECPCLDVKKWLKEINFHL